MKSVLVLSCLVVASAVAIDSFIQQPGGNGFQTGFGYFRGQSATEAPSIGFPSVPLRQRQTHQSYRQHTQLGLRHTPIRQPQRQQFEQTQPQYVHQYEYDTDQYDYSQNNQADNTYHYGNDYYNSGYVARSRDSKASPSTSNVRSHKYVPVVVKKKTQKKKKIISTNYGFYIPGGTQMYGKFLDLKSCQKACELTPTCFAGDYNPWLKKCFMHNNLTACQSMRSHSQITHFKKVPCMVVESARGLVTLGAQIYKGIEQKHIRSLSDCIKKCSTLGGGIAATDAAIDSTPQLCFGVDYDFSHHKCYFHTTNYCGTVNPVLTPEQMVQRPSSINILICPQST